MAMALRKVLLAVGFTVQAAAQEATSTTTAIPGSCKAPLLSSAASVDASSCSGLPPATCVVECAAGYQGGAATYYCYSSADGFTGTGPECNAVIASPTPAPASVPTPAPAPVPTFAPSTPMQIGLEIVVKGISYTSLIADGELKSAFEGAVKGAIADGRDIEESDVAVQLSSGSVIVNALVTSSAGEFHALLADFNATTTSLAEAVVQDVAAMPGIGNVTTGTIEASVSEIQVQVSPLPTPAPTPTPPAPTPMELDSFAHMPSARMLVLAVLATVIAAA